MGELSNIKSHALTERVEDRLYKFILAEDMPIGAKLPNEFQLADRFGVSRSTVREAVKLLVSKGILRVKHGSGTYLASRTSIQEDPLGLKAVKDKIRVALDMIDVRLMLEPGIAELAALNRSDEEAQELVRFCDAVRQKIEAGEDYIDADTLLHSHIAKCSHNLVVKSLMPIIDTSMLQVANVTRMELLAATIQTHDRIVEAILGRDPVAARLAMSMHLTLNRDYITQEYRKAKEKSSDD